jgi:acyl carrier protein
MNFDIGTFSAQQVATWLQEQIGAYLQQPPHSIEVHRPLLEYGIDSVFAIGLCCDLEVWLGVPIEPTLLWDYPTINSIVSHLREASS